MGLLFRSLAVALIGVLIIGLYVLTAGGVMDGMPKNALLFYRPAEGVYASPPCVMAGQTELPFAVVEKEANGRIHSVLRIEGTSLVEIYGHMTKPARPDQKCAEAAGFTGTSIPLWRHLLGWEAESRWDENGEWKW